MKPVAPTARIKRARKAASAQPLPLKMAAAAGLTKGAKTTHLNAKVTPALFAAAATRIGTRSPSAVIEAALATQDDLGPWLAAQWGALADVDPDILAEMNF